ncbi:MAG: molecular chaperone DnaK [Myxococcota bacterium]|nr:molecular chaperone DnaK [Myxococcota bacterium]
MGRVIGIDLGTTNSCVAVVDDGQPVVIPNAGGYKTTPSVFAIASECEYLVGYRAKRQAITNAKDTVFAAKRLIGRRFDSVEVQRSRGLYPYAILEGPNADPRIRVADRIFTCSEISATILQEMKKVAEAYLGESVDAAVITVPAYFNDAQRQSTQDAGRIAGLDVLRIINEPAAAALAYGMGREEEEKIAIYDLGGGTFDMSILEMSAGVVEVLATAGNTFLGGEDFDRRIVDHLLDVFEKDTGIDLKGDPVAMQRLKDAAEKAKCTLSLREVAEINLPFLGSGAEGPCHLACEIRRDELESLVEDIVDGTLESVQRCVKDAGLNADEIDHVVVVGGQSRMPMVQQAVANYFGQRPHKGVNPDEVVALGAAIQGSALVEGTQDVLLLDVTPLSLGISTYGGHFSRLIERNTTVPVNKSHLFTTTRDDQAAVKIRVFQGENEQALENDMLGEFVLSGIPPAPKGEPEIEVGFDIDSSGIVSVSARDLATGRQQSITVNSKSSLSCEEVDLIIEENTRLELAFRG